MMRRCEHLDTTPTQPRVTIDGAQGVCISCASRLTEEMLSTSSPAEIVFRFTLDTVSRIGLIGHLTWKWSLLKSQDNNLAAERLSKVIGVLRGEVVQNPRVEYVH